MNADAGIPAHKVFNFDNGIVFSSNFDNGNLAKVEQVPNRPHDFKIWTAPDNMGTPHQSRHCAWFHFMVTGLPLGCVLRIQVINTSNHAGLYKYDMRPVYRSKTTNQKWVRIKSSVRFSKENSVPQLYFEHGVEAADDKLVFAFTYPYSYSMMQTELDEFDSIHTNHLEDDDSIFYQRELVTNSLDGRRIDLLTISSVNGICKSGSREPLLSGLFPDASKPADRPPMFPGKEIVFISARVHPGEVPAQHTFKGILDLLLDPNDLRARALRARYVFKLIPMLNPDGVYRGHFRMDQMGNNLNRYYISNDPAIHRSIFAAKSLTDYYAGLGKLSVYLDFHAHASKRGCFIYGNVLDSAEDQIQNQLYCKLISMNSAHFDYEGCLFSKDHMTRIDPGDQAKGLTAEGSGRVSTYLAHGLIHSYTIECNYNTSRVGNEVCAPDSDPCGAQVTPASPFTTNPEKYTPTTFAGVGRACVIALLDIRGHNPCSRISKSKFKTLERVRNSIMMEVRSRKEYMGKTINRDRRRSVTAQERRVIASEGAPLLSQDDLCWRRVVDGPNSGEETSANAGSGDGSFASNGGSVSAKQSSSNKSGDAFFVPVKEGNSRRRRRSVSNTTSGQAKSDAPGINAGNKDIPDTAGNAIATLSTASGLASTTTHAETLQMLLSATPSRPTPVEPVEQKSVNTAMGPVAVMEETYLHPNALLPHFGSKTNDGSRTNPPSSYYAFARGDSSSAPPHSSTSSSKLKNTPRGDTPSNLSVGGISNAPTAAPTAAAGMNNLNIPAAPAATSNTNTTTSKSSSNGSATPAGAAAGSLSWSGKTNSSSSRNILGKKLHAAGVALLMNNPNVPSTGANTADVSSGLDEDGQIRSQISSSANGMSADCIVDSLVKFRPAPQLPVSVRQQKEQMGQTNPPSVLLPPKQGSFRGSIKTSRKKDSSSGGGGGIAGKITTTATSSSSSSAAAEERVGVGLAVRRNRPSNGSSRKIPAANNNNNIDNNISLQVAVPAGVGGSDHSRGLLTSVVPGKGKRASLHVSASDTLDGTAEMGGIASTSTSSNAVKGGEVESKGSCEDTISGAAKLQLIAPNLQKPGFLNK